jgi:hypothetical protein
MKGKAMTQQYPGGYYPNPNIPGLPPAPQPPKQKRRWPWIVGGILAFFVLVGACNSGAKPSNNSAPYYGPSGSTAAATAAAPAQAPKPSGPLTQFGDGTYEVGKDVAPGRYKTPGPDKNDSWPMCYWARRKDDSGGFGSIIASDNIQGQGSVTIRAGEFFEASGGCAWTKQ